MKRAFLWLIIISMIAVFSLTSCKTEVPPAEKMAEALKAVGWIDSQGGVKHIVSPWGEFGKDGCIDYWALIKAEDIEALAKIDVTPEQFVAGLRALGQLSGLVPVEGTKARLDMPVSGPYLSDYGASVASYISQW